LSRRSMLRPVSTEIAAVLQRQVTAAFRAGDLDAAEQALLRLEAADPLSVTTRGLRLELLHRVGRRDEAAALAEQLVAFFPGSARIHLLAGQVALERREHAAAVAYLRESEKLWPQPFTRRLLGHALTNIGCFEEAEGLLLEVARADPRSRRDLAWLYERKGQL